jgi:acyl carrier protein
MMDQRFTRADVVDRIAGILTDMLVDWSPGDGEHLHLFDDLGLDSLDGYEMVVRLEEAFGEAAGADDFARALSIRSVVEVVCTKLDQVDRFDP